MDEFITKKTLNIKYSDIKAKSFKNTIQSTWTLFSLLSDLDKNMLLKGLIKRCSSLQIEYICTELNLKATETTFDMYRKVTLLIV